jgi:hypothetical protein
MKPAVPPAVALAIFLAACQTPTAADAPTRATSAATTQAARAPEPLVTPPASFPGPETLLLPQARFSFDTGPDGKSIPTPKAATLLMLRPQGNSFAAEVLEDPDSRVFHKAECVDFGAGPRILTIGGTAAYAKLWRRGTSGTWQSDTLWHPSFGGKWDRLRDFEIGDVNGDGKDEIVFVTHDQGVVAVASLVGSEWHVEEVYRRPDTFVHEVEIGDVDGDGKAEFFVTPSTPNNANAAQQGEILAFKYTGAKGYKVETVASFKAAHVKEILTADMDADGKAELYAAVEPTRGEGAHSSTAVEIRRYRPQSGRWQAELIAALPDAVQARVLLAADLTGAGRDELVVTTMRSGVWRLVPPAAHGKGAWQPVLIDAEANGFENAAGLADVDGDGRPELYVSADEQDEIRQYRWDGVRMARRTIYGMDHADITWNILPCRVRMARR